MCGRYVLEGPLSRLTAYFEATLWQEGPYEWHSLFNIAPTMEVPVIRLNQQGQRVLLPHRWGLVPSWAKDEKSGAKLNNARAETIADKPSFRVPYRRYRCLVPATGYYEWQAPQQNQKRKQPWFIKSERLPYLAMAGVCDHWRKPDGQLLMTFAIVTTAAHHNIAHIHDRMPVMVDQSNWEAWLDKTMQNPANLTHLLEPTSQLTAFPVGYEVSGVGATRRDDPGLIAPL